MFKGIVLFLLWLGVIALALYLGVYVLLVGAVVSIIEGAKATPVDSYMIAWGVVKFFFAAPVGWLTFFFGSAFLSIFKD